MSKTGRTGSSMARVLEYAAKRPGVLLHLAEIAHGTGLTERQVQQAIANARRAVTVDGRALGLFETQIRGRAWVYRPAVADGAGPEPTVPEQPAAVPAPLANGHASATRRLFEEVGEARDGTLVLQGEDGGLFLARAVVAA